MTSLPSSLQAKLNQIQYMASATTPRRERAVVRNSLITSLPPDKVKGVLLSTKYDTNLEAHNNYTKVLQSRVLEQDSNGVDSFTKTQLYGLEWEFELNSDPFMYSPQISREVLTKTLINCCGKGGAEHIGDGSLSGDWGREVVFKPATYFELKSMLTKIKLTNFQKYINQDLTFRKAGVHVHVDDKTMTTLGYIKLWGLINLASNVPFWKVYGRRYERGNDDSDKYRYCSWRPCTVESLTKWAKEPSRFVSVASGGKYSSINYTSRGTFEVRMFNGAPNVDHLLEYVEAVASMCDWTHNSKVVGDYRVESWINFVNANREVYPNAYRRITEVQTIFYNHYHSGKKKDKLPTHVIPQEEQQPTF